MCRNKTIKKNNSDHPHTCDVCVRLCVLVCLKKVFEVGSFCLIVCNSNIKKNKRERERERADKEY